MALLPLLSRPPAADLAGQDDAGLRLGHHRSEQHVRDERAERKDRQRPRHDRGNGIERRITAGRVKCRTDAGHIRGHRGSHRPLGETHQPDQRERYPRGSGGRKDG